MRQHPETAMDVQERAETEAGIDISTPATGVDAVPEPIEPEPKPRSHLHQQPKPTSDQHQQHAHNEKPYGDPYHREEPRPQNRMAEPHANRRPGRPRKIG